MGQKKVSEVRYTAVVFTATPAILTGLAHSAGFTSLICGVLLSVSSLVCLAIAICLFDIARRNPADSHTWHTMALDYYNNVISVHIRGPQVLAEFQESFQDCRSHQDRLLSHIIEKNKDTAYGRDHNLASITSREDFISRHPLTTYAPYEPYVKRIMEGEVNVMTSDPVTFLALTSGTTGKNKVYPMTDAHFVHFTAMRKGGMKKHYDFYGTHGLARKFEFRLFYPPSMSPAGIGMGGVGSHVIPSGSTNLTPVSFRRLKKEDGIFYSQAVFSLAEPEIGFIDGFSSDIFLAFWQFMVAHHERLCDDIARGVIEPFSDLEGDILDDMNRYMRPNGRRAAELRQEFRGPAVGLARRIWPRLSAVVGVKTGSFALTARILLDTYIKGVPMNFFAHGGSEGWVGEQLEEDYNAEEYTMIPFACFLEFIRAEDSDQDNPKTFFLDQLEVGESYETVVTNLSGLYRFRVGDVLRITGYEGNTPKYVFSHRTGQVLNLVFERTPEFALLAAVRNAESRLGDDVLIQNYTVTESFHMANITGTAYAKPCYVFFVEVTKGGEHFLLSDEHKSQFENALYEAHEAYGDFRRQESVGPMEVVQVASGTFHELRNILTVPSIQFKMPRVLRKPEGLTLLWNARIQ